MFIRSECLVHLIRQFRRENSDRHVGILTKELIRRVLGALPGSGGNTSDLHAATVRETVNLSPKHGRRFSSVPKANFG